MPSSHGATFTYDDADRVWLVDFPALAGCHTYDEDDVEVEEDVRPRTAATG
ncbi:MAG: hypothetical protein ACR2KK_24135 [Acidimicrobiales bacterium]